MPEERTSISRVLSQQVLREVNETLWRDQDSARLSIGEVVRLTGASYAQLRYWEKLGLIRPQRGPNGRPAREYTLQDLRRALWLARFLSHNGGTPKRVKEMLEAGSPSGDSLLKASLSSVWYGPAVSFSIEDHINRASEAPLFHFLAPRVAKACLSLICGGLYPDTGFAMAMRRPNGSLPVDTSCLDSSLRHERTSLNESLVSLGKSMLCFHNDQGLVSLLTQRILYLADPTSIPYTEIHCGHVGQIVVIGVDKHDLGETTHCDKDNDRHQALERLLAFLLELMQKQEEIGHTSPVSSVHSGSGVSTELRLNGLADAAVRLGEGRWSFCCILAASRRDIPIWNKARLQVIGYSKRCPHGRDVRLEPREGISSLAYELGQVVYVPDVAQEPHLIARHSAEKNVQSAIAVPAVYAGRCMGVLYVASEQKRAFDRSDEIVLSLLGLAVAQVLTIGAATIEFNNMIEHAATHPRVGNPMFAMFNTKREFKTALLTKIKEAREETADKPSWLLAVDINGSRELCAKDGTREEWILNHCWQRVGQTTLRMLEQSPAARSLREGTKGNLRLYRTGVDRYVVILENVPEQWVLQFGALLKQEINSTPIELQANSHVYKVPVSVRVAMWRGTIEFLRHLALTGESKAAERVVQLLEETLEYARDHGSVAFRNNGENPEARSTAVKSGDSLG